jgi:hypothetical protein
MNPVSMNPVSNKSRSENIPRGMPRCPRAIRININTLRIEDPLQLAAETFGIFGDDNDALLPA